MSQSDSQFSDLDLALGLGLGLPLMLITGGLIFCKCCCKQWKSISSIFSRQHDNRTDTNNNHTESIQKSVNDIKENKDLRNPLPDYRQQYINDGHKSYSKQTKIPNEKRLLTLKNSLTSMPSHDFKQNSMNVTRTTFFSHSLNNLATNNIQCTKDYSSKSPKITNYDSVLVHAYCNQENQKAILHERLS